MRLPLRQEVKLKAEVASKEQHLLDIMREVSLLSPKVKIGGDQVSPKYAVVPLPYDKMIKFMAMLESPTRGGSAIGILGFSQMRMGA